MFEAPDSPGTSPFLPAARRLRGLVFDLDGTLIDSVEDLRAALNRLLAGRGRPPLERSAVQAMVGDGARKLVERALTAAHGAAPDVATLDPALTAFLADYEAAAAVHTRAYPGVREVLTRLRGAGLKLAICTNKPYAASVAVLDALQLSDAFDAVIGGDSTPARKPDPQPLQAALDALGLPPGGAVMIGDGPHDALAAAAAGTGFIGVTYGYGTAGFAALTPAPITIDRFADLPARLGLTGG
ncbi:phosphoglycolate phosphatase [Solimonas sp. C16B3]|uniref:Phosphoglycolate phosphatase n=2 Tax=Solimonas marina TaxID=2714601 RepID=A0A969WFQ8_9GAMM|nr:phosphoglycolate phosphatase [Solimonas marina]NKF23895.1 phosphoglycolate phosphatase [Solimonas marina]